MPLIIVTNCITLWYHSINIVKIHNYESKYARERGIRVRKNRLSFIFILLMIILSTANICYGSAQNKEFVDLDNHWSRDYVLPLTAKGIIEGYSDGTFKPNNKITVAEFIKVVTVAMELDLDSNEGPWYQMFINCAQDEGIIQNDEFTEEDYSRLITRGEIARIVARAVKKLPIEGNTNYKDSIETPTAYRGYINAVSQLNIMEGYPNGTFGYQSNGTRAETAVIINRMLRVKAGESLRPSDMNEGFVEPILVVVQNEGFRRSAGRIFWIEINNIDDYTDEYQFKAECVSFPALNQRNAFDGKGVYKLDRTVWRDKNFVKGWGKIIIDAPINGFEYIEGQEVTYRITVKKGDIENHYYRTGVITSYGLGFYD